MSAEESTHKNIITRKEHMTRNNDMSSSKTSREQNHRDFYAQFVTDETLRFINQAFDIETLRQVAAQDPVHLNSTIVPGERWDLVCNGAPRPDFGKGLGKPLVPLDREAWKTATGSTGATPSDMICIGKEAARILLERHQTTE